MPVFNLTRVSFYFINITIARTTTNKTTIRMKGVKGRAFLSIYLFKWDLLGPYCVRMMLGFLVHM